ncbi:hypothetical protein IHQ68_18320 [Chelatococcus sambhunathii]|uniref:Uncharacterized protein n=1 Tax=Chelatococcus sambhunathii TaxID=363953 RepID=A0ABU1DKD5_9HYPH|nr:hypothetical protein [Chelatococcus sambhunathii]MDR4308580.1 hypothetical protein [Chelatococcus sambhunathii]
MSNDDVNAVVLRLARTLQRCGEDTGVVFAALIGAAATVASDLGEHAETPDGLKKAIDSVISFGDLRGVPTASGRGGAAVIPFRPARVA